MKKILFILEVMLLLSPIPFVSGMALGREHPVYSGSRNYSMNDTTRARRNTALYSPVLKNS